MQPNWLIVGGALITTIFVALSYLTDPFNLKTTHSLKSSGLIPADEYFLATLKQHILQTFWLDDKGYFLEDLSHSKPLMRPK